MSKESPILVELEKLLSQHTAEGKKTAFPLADTGMTFYQVSSAGTTQLSTTLNTFKVKPFTFDVFLALGIVLYLVLLHLYLKAPAKLEDWRSIFGRKPEKITRGNK